MTEKVEHNQGELVVWQQDGKITSAWLMNGSYSLPITDEEQLLSIEDFCQLIEEEQKAGIFRCSWCNSKMKQKGHFHLFSSYVCDTCHEKAEEQAKHESKCCSCGKPLSKCYC